MSIEVSKENEIINFKILLLGDESVGKSSFILRFCEDKYNEDCPLTTIGLDQKVKFIKKDGKKFKLFIWDTAGQERFRSVANNVFKGADGIILMYDNSNYETFKSIKSWINRIKDVTDINKIGIIVVGNNCEISDYEKQVDEETKKIFEEQNNLKIIDASSKTNYNVNESFLALIDRMLELGLDKKTGDNDEVNNSHKLKLDKTKKKRDCCGIKKK